MSLIFPEKEKPFCPLYSRSPFRCPGNHQKSLSSTWLAYRKLEKLLRSLESIHLSWGRNVAAKRRYRERQATTKTPACFS